MNSSNEITKYTEVKNHFLHSKALWLGTREAVRQEIGPALAYYFHCKDDLISIEFHDEIVSPAFYKCNLLLSIEFKFQDTIPSQKIGVNIRFERTTETIAIYRDHIFNLMDQITNLFDAILEEYKEQFTLRTLEAGHQQNQG